MRSQRWSTSTSTRWVRGESATRSTGVGRSRRPPIAVGALASARGRARRGARVGLDLGDLHGRGRGVGVGDRVPAARGGPRHLQLEHDFVGLTGDGDAARCADLPDSVAVEVGGDGLARNELAAEERGTRGTMSLPLAHTLWRCPWLAK